MALAQLIRNKQPKLFDYLLNLRDKTKVEALVNKRDPLIYTSGRYPSEFEKTTAAVMIAPRADRPGALMYDLRIDPNEFIKLSPAELAKRWAARGEEVPYFPVKTLSYNKSPAIAPMSVLDKESAKRLKLSETEISENLKKLQPAKDFGDKLGLALAIVYPPHQPQMVIDEQKVDEQLYEGFVSDPDRTKMAVVRAAEPDELSDLRLDFADDRLKALLPLYKARNFPRSLSPTESAAWEKFKTKRLLGGDEASRAAKYFERLEELTKQPRLNHEQKYLLEELQLYGQSILPAGE
jgi:exodeoxyribonuclease-1